MKTKPCIKKMNSAFILFTCLLVLSGTGATAAENNFKVITTDQLKQMADQKKDFVLIDARSPQEYDEAHIKGAVNIPDKNFEEKKNLLPENKAMQIIIYCNGIQCGKSKRLADKIAPLGYTNITLYSEGIPVWEERSLPLVTGPEYGKKIQTKMLKPAEVKAIIDAKKSDYILVDVRDTTEFSEGHIPTAINIPAEKFALESGKLPKTKKIIVYCNTGSRSYLCYKKLIGLAYTDINQTLFAEWKNSKMDVEK